jgi:hypothetical protein
MTFVPQTLQWPGKRAILMVHGIGNASDGKDGAFPSDTLRTALGDDAASTAIYRLNYDFINDWLATKVNFSAGINALTTAVGVELGGDDFNGLIAEYAGDVLWPILSPSLRFAVRDAFASQLQQMLRDRDNAADRRGDNPRKYQISIVAHSLGCYHTYEMLTAAANDLALELSPASDLVTFESVILMASPVQLIRTIGGAISAFIPDLGSVATLSAPLAIPQEVKRGRAKLCTKNFVSVTGSRDPVGGHLLGKQLKWAYMDIPGQVSVVVPQEGLNLNTAQDTALALASAFGGGGPTINDPHSWTNYLAGQATLLQDGVVA